MIYYVEDDQNIRDLVVYTLTQTGLEAAGFSDGQTFYAACQEQLPDLVLLDIMLPNEDGISMLKRWKTDIKTRGIPVIMVTAKGTEYDKVLGLDAGADDYIAKPFGMMELVARIRARLRANGAKSGENVITAGALSLDTRKHAVTVSGNAILLTLKEYELLYVLMQQRGKVFTREQLLERVWDYGYDGGTRTVDVHIQTLRAKLGDCGALVETVRGVGYRFGD